MPRNDPAAYSPEQLAKLARIAEDPSVRAEVRRAARDRLAAAGAPPPAPTERGEPMGPPPPPPPPPGRPMALPPGAGSFVAGGGPIPTSAQTLREMPAQVEQAKALVGGVDRGALLGAGRALGGALGVDLGVGQAMARHPVAAAAGEVAGSLHPGAPAARLSGAVMKQAGKRLGGGALSKIGGALGIGALESGAVASSDAAAGSGEWGDVPDAALMGGALGGGLGGLGAGVGKVAEGAQWLQRKVRDVIPDIERAERAGYRTDVRKGMTGTPAHDAALKRLGPDELRTPAQRAAEPVADEVTEGISGEIDRLTYLRDKAEREYMTGPGQQTQPLDAVARAGLDFLRDRQGTGPLAAGMVQQIRRYAKVRKLGRKQLEAARARGSLVVSGQDAANLGFKPGPKGKPVYVELEPYRMNAKEIQTAINDLSTMMSDPATASGKPYFEEAQQALLRVRDRYPHMGGVTPEGVMSKDGLEPRTGYSALQNKYNQELELLEERLQKAGGGSPGEMRERITRYGSRANLEHDRGLEAAADVVDDKLTRDATQQAEMEGSLRAPRAVEDPEGLMQEGIGGEFGAQRVQRDRRNEFVEAGGAEGDTLADELGDAADDFADDFDSLPPDPRAPTELPPGAVDPRAPTDLPPPTRDVNAEKALIAQTDRAAATLEPEELAAVRAYTGARGDPASPAMKRALVKLRVANPTRVGPLWHGTRVPDVQELVSRGLDPRGVPLSTTFNELIASSMAASRTQRGAHPVMIRFDRVPEVASLASRQLGIGGTSGEREMLLHTGRWRLRDTGEMMDGQRLLVATEVGPTRKRLEEAAGTAAADRARAGGDPARILSSGMLNPIRLGLRGMVRVDPLLRATAGARFRPEIPARLLDTATNSAEDVANWLQETERNER